MKLTNIFLISYISILDRQPNLAEMFPGVGSLLCCCVGIVWCLLYLFSIRHLVIAPFGNTKKPNGHNLRLSPFLYLFSFKFTGLVALIRTDVA